MPATQADNLKALLERFDTAMLVTHTAKGRIRARPMVIAKIEENCDLSFLTAQQTAKVHEIENDKDVCVVCQEGASLCISISGRAQLVDDRTKVRQLWRDDFRSWFPAGPDDPEIRLIYIRGEEAEYWQSEGTKASTFLFRGAHGFVAGSSDDADKKRETIKLATV